MNLQEVEQNLLLNSLTECFNDPESYHTFSYDSLDDLAYLDNDMWWVQSEEIDNNLNIYKNPITCKSAESPTSSVKRKTRDNLASNFHVEYIQPNKTKCRNSTRNRIPTRARKSTVNPRGNNINCDNKDSWAGQLLMPCSAAISSGDLTRAQHLLYVLHELASLTGDASSRLAAHGLSSLKRYVTPYSSSHDEVIHFASTNPTFFRQSLIDFNDISPWFSIPNDITNSSILQILSTENPSNHLHILDIGVSPGVQWPILLESLTRQPYGPPSLVKLTVITNNHTTNSSFVTAPPGYDFTAKLLSFAKKLKINLKITHLESRALQNINAQVLDCSPDDTLIVCAQFRLHHLRHDTDERTEFLKLLNGLKPKGLILNENSMIDCPCKNSADFATAFSRRMEFLWLFLDSTSAAFKGGEKTERRMMEGEAAKVLTNAVLMNEKKDKWCHRMRTVGFTQDKFGENVIGKARSLLKKYDSKWEISVGELDECVDLKWKNQPVSFCSLWKVDTKSKAY